MGKFCGSSHPDNQGFGCIGCKNFWSTSVNVVVYLGSSYFTVFLLWVEVDMLYQLVIIVGSLGLGNLGWTKVTYVIYPSR